jgi:hypothetical protein
VMQLSFVDTCRRFIRNLFPPTGGRRFTWKIGLCLPDYTPSNIRKPYFLYSSYFLTLTNESTLLLL